nr:lysine-rich arabinogalactan protein 19-like [Aegilops tauschii subsp. strangulata]
MSPPRSPSPPGSSARAPHQPSPRLTVPPCTVAASFAVAAPRPRPGQPPHRLAAAIASTLLRYRRRVLSRRRSCSLYPLPPRPVQAALSPSPPASGHRPPPAPAPCRVRPPRAPLGVRPLGLRPAPGARLGPLWVNDQWGPAPKNVKKK